MNVRWAIAGWMLVAAMAAAPAFSATADSLTTIVLPDSGGTITGVVSSDTLQLTDPAAIKATLGLMGRREIEAPREWERRKNPRVAMLSSAVLPGLGQVYNGRRLKVGVMTGFAYYYMSRTWLNWRRYRKHAGLRDLSAPGSSDFDHNNRLSEFYKEEARTFLWWSGLVWMLGIIDSWIDAHLYDVRAYQPPPPPASSGLPVSGAGTTYVTWSLSLSITNGK